MKPTTKEKILLLLTAGAVLTLKRTPRGNLRLFKSVAREWRRIERRDLYRNVREFYDNRLVSYEEMEDGLIKVVISEAGQRRKLQFDLDRLEIKQPKLWDRQWRLVAFDIPEKKRSGRDALRRKLKELGFCEWQKSLFIHPFPCRDEIDFVVEVLDLRPYVRLAELVDPTNEAELKLHFDLA